ncbi:hypothetical protein DPEC_G00238370 [Dallia pectoralis]|uniref:Uncharacterized protein n=1 Tax=Dallia pectoralis TaxID=75939 RepID=A0ACC2FYY2_DALPE|nr:hypothetical protein DPEC_G00238370 [Dallia pectoralis]
MKGCTWSAIIFRKKKMMEEPGAPTLALDCEEIRVQVARMIVQVLLTGMLCSLLPGLLDATPLKTRAVGEVSIDPNQAHGFLSQPRPKRNIDPKWHRGTPDFQSYYKFYNSIGHIEGLYEIDRIRILYQQMRHLEQVYGPDASSYQNALGVITPPPTTAAPTTTLPPPATPAPVSLTKADVLYLCNTKDPLCKAHVVYLPAGAVPVLCDPRYNPACKPQTGRVVIAASPIKPAPVAPVQTAVREPLLPPPPKKSLTPPPASPVVIKGMEYDCDPYWDPDCLIDHPPRHVKATQAPPPPEVEKEGDAGEYVPVGPANINTSPYEMSAPAAAGAPAEGAAPPPNLTSNRRLQQTQAQVDEVVDIMRVNVDKVLERDQKLSELDDRADALQAGASQFETSAAKLKNKYWWKNAKMMIILGLICAIVLIVIIVYFST